MSTPLFLKISIICFFLFLSATSILAADPLNVVVNEIAWMGRESSHSDEWIELYNTTNKEIDISGWQIENAKPKNETLIILAAKIPAKGYFLICRKEINDCDLIESKSSLHNEYNKNGKLVLKETTGNIIDTTPEANDKQWPAGNNETKQTMERKNSSVSGNDPENWQTSKESGGTPKTENSIVTIQPPEEILPETELEPESEHQEKPHEKLEPAIYPSNIFLNEILPSPEGPDAENEWIEIFNGNNFEVDVSEWQIRDTIGATKTYTIPKGTKIDPNSFLLLPRPETKITLQNSGDVLELLNPIGEVVHKTNYPKAPLGQSYNRTLSGWAWSGSLTPGETNIITQSEIPKTDSSETFEEKEGSEKALAKIGDELPKSSSPLIVFLIALTIAISSGIIVLFLKKRAKTEEQ